MNGIPFRVLSVRFEKPYIKEERRRVGAVQKFDGARRHIRRGGCLGPASYPSAKRLGRDLPGSVARRSSRSRPCSGTSALGRDRLAQATRWRDNKVVYVPTGYVNQAQLGDIVAQAAQDLGPEVVHVAYSLGPDSTGEPSLFFRILLADSYIREDTIADLTGRIAAALFDLIRPIENWGLRPYFNFRSKSEQDGRRDPDWL
jgi:hypothetical protein